MKKGIIKYTAILILLITYHTLSIAQSPEKFSYQAVVRDATELLLTNQVIGLQITILRGAVPVYVETHTPTTNINALVSVEVGTGIIVSGVFADINWSSGTYYIKADIDPTGGTTYSITGTAQLLSMPYAFYAKTAENGFSGNFNDLTNKPTWDGSETKLTAGSKVTITGTGTSVAPYMVSATVPVSAFEHYIGEEYDGGIIFYIYAGSDGLEHLLIVHLNEDPGKAWQSVNNLDGANRSWDGAYNMPRMTNSPARTYVESLGSGWYLPAIDELSLLWQNRFQVNQGLEGAGGTILSTVDISTNNYWSSTEGLSSSYAWYFSFNTGDIKGTAAGGANPKGNNRRIRAVRHTLAITGSPLGGGVVAYVFQPGDPGYVIGETHGIISATADLSPGEWGCWGIDQPPAGPMPTAIGSGAQNTIDIVTNCAEPGIAARLCSDYTNVDTGTGVYTDWFLPSLNELQKMYLTRSLIGGFAAALYWSSSEGSVTQAGEVNFANGSPNFLPRNTPYNVRPIRYF